MRYRCGWLDASRSNSPFLHSASFLHSGGVNSGVGNVSPNFSPTNPRTQCGRLGMLSSGINNQGLSASLSSLLGVDNHGTFNQCLFNTGIDNMGNDNMGNDNMGIGPLHVGCQSRTVKELLRACAAEAFGRSAAGAIGPQMPFTEERVDRLFPAVHRGGRAEWSDRWLAAP